MLGHMYAHPAPFIHIQLDIQLDSAEFRASSRQPVRHTACTVLETVENMTFHAQI